MKLVHPSLAIAAVLASLAGCSTPESARTQEQTASNAQALYLYDDASTSNCSSTTIDQALGKTFDAGTDDFSSNTVAGFLAAAYDEYIQGTTNTTCNSGFDTIASQLAHIHAAYGSATLAAAGVSLSSDFAFVTNSASICAATILITIHDRNGTSPFSHEQRALVYLHRAMELGNQAISKAESCAISDLGYSLVATPPGPDAGFGCSNIP